MLVDLAGLAELLDHALIHHRDAVAHRQRLVLVVRDVDERGLQLELDALELELHLLAQLHVEGPERLVEQQRCRLVHERTSERDTLLLPSRELTGPALLQSPEPDDLEHLRDDRRPVALRHLLQFQPVLDVALDVHVREQRVVLEAHVHLALVRRHPDDVDPAQKDRALVGFLESGDHAHRRRLAAPRRAEQRDELALGDVERDAVDGVHVAEEVANPGC